MTYPPPAVDEFPDRADEQPPPSYWQKAKQQAAELLLELELPTPAPRTHVDIATDGARGETLFLLRAFVRAAERAGHKVKLL